MLTATSPTIKTEIDLVRYNGMITVRNPATDGHRTFKITTVAKGKLAGKRICSLLTGPDNQSDYHGFGFVTEQGVVVVWRSKLGTDFEKLAAILNNPEKYATVHGLEYQFSVKCRKCNRDLTDPKSIEMGIGPICRGE